MPTPVESLQWNRSWRPGQGATGRAMDHTRIGPYRDEDDDND